MTMIENGERGITLARPLAWSILAALVGAGIWIGAQIGALTEVRRTAERNLAGLERVAERQRAADLRAVRIDAKLDALLDLTERIDKRLEEVEARTPPTGRLLQGPALEEDAR